jgi:hypothetical protein
MSSNRPWNVNDDDRRRRRGGARRGSCGRGRQRGSRSAAAATATAAAGVKQPRRRRARGQARTGAHGHQLGLGASRVRRRRLRGAPFLRAAKPAGRMDRDLPCATMAYEPGVSDAPRAERERKGQTWRRADKAPAPEAAPGACSVAADACRGPAAPAAVPAAAPVPIEPPVVDCTMLGCTLGEAVGPAELYLCCVRTACTKHR